MSLNTAWYLTMKFSLFNNFGAKNSGPVFSAFQDGLTKLGIQWNHHDMTADIAVIWSVVWAGRMKQNKEVWDHFRSQGKSVIVLEVGMLQRGYTWKMGVNGTGADAYYGKHFDPTRPQKLKMNVRPWQKTSGNIIVAVQRHDSQQWHSMPATNIWLENITSQIMQFTDRPIIIRSHPRQSITAPRGCLLEHPSPIPNTYDDFDYNNSINHSWAVINWNSGTGPQAILAGIPAFTGISSLAAPVANLDLANIENPSRPDRADWIIKLSHTEWTLQEISSGKPVSRLLDFIEC